MRCYFGKKNELYANEEHCSEIRPEVVAEMMSVYAKIYPLEFDPSILMSVDTDMMKWCLEAAL